MIENYYNYFYDWWYNNERDNIINKILENSRINVNFVR